MQQKHIPDFSASCTYFLVISIIPLLILITSLLPYTAISEADLYNAVMEIAPDFSGEIVRNLIDEAYMQSVAVFSISALTTIWAGAQGMLAMIRGLNSIYDVEEKRNYFHLRIIASFYTVTMIIMIMIMLLIMVFEKQLRALTLDYVPELAFFFSVSSYFKFLLVILLATLSFALIYTFIPSAKMVFVYQLPGAVFSAVVWYIFSWLFSIYVNYPGTFTAYGSIATPLVLMIWMYFCVYIFMIGALINQFFHPAVKLLYDDHHRKTVHKNVKKKSTQRLRKPRKYNEFG
ncbi:MAG: YihY/virulence factor BrkB family protein [Butyrivibrio sp.]|nr:YihY/virulence factor BrkB family protein [Butyrivibrio sp.]